MDINTVLTAAGIAATVLLGIGAIYLAVRYSRQVGIAYVEDSCLALIDDVTQGIGDLEIRFRNSPISQNIVLLRGFFINTGQRDISPDMVEQPLRLVLPEGFEWIDCQITDRVKDLNVEVAEVTKEGIEFSIGLLKTQEYFKFDALATVPSDENATSPAPNIYLRQVLEFDYRITDTHGIQRLHRRDLQISPFLGIPLRRGGRRLTTIFRAATSPLIGIVLVLVGIGMYALLISFETKRIAYEIVGTDNQPTVANVRVKGDEIELYNQDGFQSRLSTKAFDDLKKKAVLQPLSQRFITIFLAIYVGLGILILLTTSVRFIRTRKYRHLLRLE